MRALLIAAAVFAASPALAQGNPTVAPLDVVRCQAVQYSANQQPVFLCTQPVQVDLCEYTMVVTKQTTPWTYSDMNLNWIQDPDTGAWRPKCATLTGPLRKIGPPPRR